MKQEEKRFQCPNCKSWSFMVQYGVQITFHSGREIVGDFLECTMCDCLLKYEDPSDLDNDKDANKKHDQKIPAAA